MPLFSLQTQKHTAPIALIAPDFSQTEAQAPPAVCEPSQSADPSSSETEDIPGVPSTPNKAPSFIPVSARSIITNVTPCHFTPMNVHRRKAERNAQARVESISASASHQRSLTMMGSATESKSQISKLDNSAIPLNFGLSDEPDNGPDNRNVEPDVASHPITTHVTAVAQIIGDLQEQERDRDIEDQENEPLGNSAENVLSYLSVHNTMLLRANPPSLSPSVPSDQEVMSDTLASTCVLPSVPLDLGLNNDHGSTEGTDQARPSLGSNAAQTTTDSASDLQESALLGQDTNIAWHGVELSTRPLETILETESMAELASDDISTPLTQNVLPVPCRSNSSHQHIMSWSSSATTTPSHPSIRSSKRKLAPAAPIPRHGSATLDSRDRVLSQRSSRSSSADTLESSQMLAFASITQIKSLSPSTQETMDDTPGAESVVAMVAETATESIAEQVTEQPSLSQDVHSTHDMSDNVESHGNDVSNNTSLPLPELLPSSTKRQKTPENTTPHEFGSVSGQNIILHPITALPLRRSSRRQLDIPQSDNTPQAAEAAETAETKENGETKPVPTAPNTVKTTRAMKNTSSSQHPASNESSGVSNEKKNTKKKTSVKSKDTPPATTQAQPTTQPLPNSKPQTDTSSGDNTQVKRSPFELCSTIQGYPFHNFNLPPESEIKKFLKSDQTLDKPMEQVATDLCISASQKPFNFAPPMRPFSLFNQTGEKQASKSVENHISCGYSKIELTNNPTRSSTVSKYTIHFDWHERQKTIEAARHHQKMNQLRMEQVDDDSNLTAPVGTTEICSEKATEICTEKATPYLNPRDEFFSHFQKPSLPSKHVALRVMEKSHQERNIPHLVEKSTLEDPINTSIVQLSSIRWNLPPKGEIFEYSLPEEFVRSYPSPYRAIISNLYLPENGVFRPSKPRKEDIDICSCLPGTTCSSDDRCELRLTMVECSSQCVNGENCTNKRLTKRCYSKTKIVETPGMGFGLVVTEDIPENSLIIEYVGEVITRETALERIQDASECGNPNFYIFSLDKHHLVDANHYGNLARFINHSCAPNCATQSWSIGSETRVGIFSLVPIKAGTELTYDYHFEAEYGVTNRCYCGAPNCSGVMGTQKKNTSVSNKGKGNGKIDNTKSK